MPGVAMHAWRSISVPHALTLWTASMVSCIPLDLSSPVAMPLHAGLSIIAHADNLHAELPCAAEKSVMILCSSLPRIASGVWRVDPLGRHSWIRPITDA